MAKRPSILIFAGSIRSGSYSQKLADAHTAQLTRFDCEITQLTLADYPLPIYDGDLEREKGIPEPAVNLARQFDRHDAIVIITPEYNGSLTPLLKNAIDWVSRVKSFGEKPVRPYAGKVMAIGSASPGAQGGMTALLHFRQVMTRLGCLVISEQLALPNAADAFDEDGGLAREREAKFLADICKSLVEKATLLARP